MFALSHCPVSPCPIVFDFVSSGACLSCCPSLCLFFEGYVVRVLSSFFSLRTVSSPALQRLVLSSLARADFPPYSTSLCCAERAAVGSPTTSSTRRTTHRSRHSSTSLLHESLRLRRVHDLDRAGDSTQGAFCSFAFDVLPALAELSNTLHLQYYSLY